MEREHDFLEFIHLSSFTRTSKKLLSEDELREVELVLIDDPQRGAVIAETGGFRKMRWAREGTGTSGGVRLIYYYQDTKGRIFLALVYPKSRKASLTKAERNELKALAKLLKAQR